MCRWCGGAMCMNCANECPDPLNARCFPCQFHWRASWVTKTCELDIPLWNDAYVNYVLGAQEMYGGTQTVRPVIGPPGMGRTFRLTTGSEPTTPSSTAAERSEFRQSATEVGLSESWITVIEDPETWLAEQQQRQQPRIAPESPDTWSASSEPATRPNDTPESAEIQLTASQLATQTANAQGLFDFSAFQDW